MRKWIESSPISIGVALIAVGLVVIFLGWNGAAGKDYVEGQLPYVLSGGLGGLAIVGGGITVIVVQTRRRDTVELAARLDELLDLLRGGAAGSATLHGPTVVPDASMVIAGASTYHDTGCRIVDGRDDLQPMSREAAASRGLTPCRICQPGDAVSA